MLELITNPSLFRIDPILKIGFLILLGVYIIFAFMLTSKIRSFNRIINLSRGSGIMLIQGFAYLFLALLLFLFIFVLVIV